MVQQAAVLRASWSLMSGDPDGLAGRFLERLMAQDASLRVLLAPAQPEMLLRQIHATLTRVMDLLEEPDQLVQLLIPLGRQLDHAGLDAKDLDVARAALIGALYDVLGHRFTPEMDEAWHELYALAVAVMLRVNHREAPEPLGSPPGE